MFAFKLGYVLNRAHELIDFVDYDDLFNKYDTLNKISFDYAVVEHEPEIEVMHFAGTWKDLGTWNTLTEAMDGHVVGEAMLNEKCENVHVVNELDVPILCMGLKDVVVSASPEGILVSDKEQSSYIKPFVNMLDHRVMFAEKSWGSFKVIDIDKESMTIKVTLNAGHRMNYHSHQHRDEVWTVIAGEGKRGDVVDGWRECEAGCHHHVGSRLNDEFEKNIDMDPLAETWECSTHPDGPSYVVSGEFGRQELAEVLRAHPEYLGERYKGENTLPILIKFIDAKKDLSVQVHPTDAYAQEHENGQLGKTEMWYVLDASKDAKLVYGLKRERTEQQVRDAIAEGTLMKDLQWVPVKKDDLFFIEAGTIHAIGAGALVAEIQENSNLTYRLYDYDRVGKDGKKRELHIDKALDVANLKSSAEPKQPLRVLKYRQGIASELLTRCKYFEVYRMIVNTERRQKVHYRADGIAFRVLLCVNGCGTISYDGGSITFYKGDCIFVPADSEILTLHGQAQFLDVRG